MGFEYHAKVASKRVAALFWEVRERSVLRKVDRRKLFFFQNFEGPLFVELNGEAKELHAKKSGDTKEIFEVIVAAEK
jgi:hypothetical protein